MKLKHIELPRYINDLVKEDEEFVGYIEEMLEHEPVRRMHQFAHHLHFSCLSHVIHVAYICYKWSKKLGLDQATVVKGALLHDFYLYDWHEKKERKGLHGFTHPKTALKNAEAHFVLNHKEKDMILSHMWPLTFLSLPKCKESILLCVVDKICAVREGMESRHHESFINEN